MSSQYPKWKNLRNKVSQAVLYYNPKYKTDTQESIEKTRDSAQFSCSVISDSLRPHELQHARPPCPLPNPGVHPNSCPSSR